MATWPTITDDDGSNTTGTVINNTNVWAPIQTYVGGAWTAVSFSAGDYTASGSMTWTVASGDVTLSRYVVVGKTLKWSVQLSTTTIGGTPSTQLRIAIPGGHTAVAVGHHVRIARCLNNGALIQAYAQVAAATYIGLVREDATSNWAAGTDNNEMAFQIEFEIA